MGDMHLHRVVIAVVVCFVTSGCVSPPRIACVDDAAMEVQSLTSIDASWQRLAFERRHGGCNDHAVHLDLTDVIDALTGRQWSGPQIQPAVLSSRQPNAFVLASGHLYVTAGLVDLICSEDELAAVIAHELAHLEDARGFFAANLSMDERRQIEAEADQRAAGRLIEAHYDPTALIDMIVRLTDDQPKGWAEFRRQQLESYLGLPIVRDVCDADDQLFTETPNTATSLSQQG